MKLIYKILVSVVCMNISMQLFCMEVNKPEAQRYIEGCDKIDGLYYEKLKTLCTQACIKNVNQEIENVKLEIDRCKKSLTNFQSRQCSETKQKYKISNDVWNSSVCLAHIRMKASFLSSGKFDSYSLQFIKKHSFILTDQIDPAFVEILQNTLIRESINPAKFRLCASKDVPYQVKTVQIARVIDDQGCPCYQETGCGFIAVNPSVINRLSCRLKKAFSLFLASCVVYHNADYLSAIEATSNVTIQNKDFIGNLTHHTLLHLVALRNEKSATLLKELLRNRNIFFDDCNDAVMYYRKMCKVYNLHRYMTWLNKLSDESYRKSLFVKEPHRSTRKGKAIQYKSVEK